MTQPPAAVRPPPRVTLRRWPNGPVCRARRRPSFSAAPRHAHLRGRGDPGAAGRPRAELPPSLLARSLRTNSSQTIGLLSDQIASEMFAGEAVRGALTTPCSTSTCCSSARPAAIRGRAQHHPGHARPWGRRLRARLHVHPGRPHPAGAAPPPGGADELLHPGKRLPAVVPDETEAGRSVARNCSPGASGRHRPGRRAHGAGDGRRGTPGRIREILTAEGTDLAGVVDTPVVAGSCLPAMATYLSGVRPAARPPPPSSS